MNRGIVFALLLTLICHRLCAQQDSLPAIALEAVEIAALRIPTSPREQPFSITTYNASTLQETRQQLSLQEYLTEMPGVFSLNANNYAQDLRISIRGFGARAAFGIRGVKIIVDGIPETTPDGQGQIDNLNIGNIQRIEVLKGPSAALYGNASGGVINITSKADFTKNFLEAGLTLGSFKMSQYQLGGGFVKKNTKLLLQAAHTRSEGYRQQSELENTNLNLRLFHKFSKRSKINAQLNYTNSPVAQDPGSLALANVDSFPKMARDRNVLFKTGEAIDQFKIGLAYEYELTENENLAFYGFYNHRNFQGLLPFNFGGWVELQRNYAGQGGHYKWNKSLAAGKNTLQLGYELATQLDARQRYRNEEGEQGDNTLDQIEKFSNAALYLLDHFKTEKLLITAGLRFDYNQLAVEDQKLDDGDQSDKRNLSALNPSLGINYELVSRLHLYTNFRSSFETPALSELSANPSGEAGFNTELSAQRAYNYELGMKGLLQERIDFDLALFYINTKNNLVPYELAAFPDRSFFRNAGSSARSGVELSTRIHFTSQITAGVNYTFSQFKYRDYELPQGDFSDNFLPGIPKHLANFSVAYRAERGLNLRLQHRYIDHFFADDANTTRTKNLHLTDFSCSYRWKGKSSTLTPFFGVNNIFNRSYFDNIRLNAFGGRYYEAAPGVNVYGGLRWRME